MSRLHEHAVIPSVISSVIDPLCVFCVSGLLSCAKQYRREISLLGPQDEGKLPTSKQYGCKMLVSGTF